MQNTILANARAAGAAASQRIPASALLGDNTAHHWQHNCNRNNGMPTTPARSGLADPEGPSTGGSAPAWPDSTTARDTMSLQNTRSYVHPTTVVYHRWHEFDDAGRTRTRARCLTLRRFRARREARRVLDQNGACSRCRFRSLCCNLVLVAVTQILPDARARVCLEHHNEHGHVTVLSTVGWQ